MVVACAILARRNGASWAGHHHNEKGERGKKGGIRCFEEDVRAFRMTRN